MNRRRRRTNEKAASAAAIVGGGLALPTQTLLMRDGEKATVIRRWAEGSTPVCGRCSRGCKASIGDDGIAICSVVVVGELSPESARTLAL